MVGALSASHCPRARGAPDPRRLVVCTAVVVAHAAVLALLTEDERRQSKQTREQAPPMVWLLPSPSTSAVPEVARVAASKRLRTASAPPRSAGPPPPPPVAAPPPPLESPAAPRIDWHAETGSAAARQLARDGETSRQASALAPPTAPQSLKDERRAPQFGWDYAATHRVEYTPGGALYINLNDRCIFAFPFLFVCKLGEATPANGNLFQHAKDPPAAGTR